MDHCDEGRTEGPIVVHAKREYVGRLLRSNGLLMDKVGELRKLLHTHDDELEKVTLAKKISSLETCMSDPSSAVQFHIRGMLTEEMNAVRRTLVADVRYLAVDVVSISANSSQMYDEMLASRIAHVPLRAPRELINNDSYTVTLKLVAAMDEDAPGLHEVMSDMLVTSDDRVQPQRGYRILRLQPGQSVDIVAVARPGTAREHTKWRAVHTSVLTQQEERADGGVANVLSVETNWQQDAVGAVCDAVDELCLRIGTTVEDIQNPQGGSDVDVIDHFDALGVGYA